MNQQSLKTIFGATTILPVKPLVEQTEYLIGGVIGQWGEPREKVYSPVGGTYLGSYPMLTSEKAMEALAAAEEAYPMWSGYTLEQRISCVTDFVKNYMKDQRETVVNLIMWEIAKTRKDAEKEFDRTIEDILAKIDEAKKLDRDSSRPQEVDGIFAQIRRAPLGVSLIMGPYNYPLNETYTLLFPSLLMGNTVIFKTPKIGVLLHQPLLKGFCDCFPKGVVNTLYGDGPTVVGPLMTSGRVNALGFIGTSKVADILVKQHPKPHRLRRIIGAEAKNPAIIMEDADLDLTVKECVTGALSYNGQRCTALKILFVQRDILKDFLPAFCKAVDALKPGYPWAEGVDLTPLPEPGKTAYLKGLVDDAVSKGAELVYGGDSVDTYFHPAILNNVSSAMRIWNEEQFGPVIPIVPFDIVEEVMEYIQKSNYGQQVSIFSRNSAKLSWVIDELSTQVCRININTQCQRGPDSFPFTGRKDSAEGTVSNSDTFKAFSTRTLVAAKITPDNKSLLRNIYRAGKSNFLNSSYIF